MRNTITICVLMALAMFAAFSASYAGSNIPATQPAAAYQTELVGISGNNIVGTYSMDGSGSNHSFLYDGKNCILLDMPKEQAQAMFLKGVSGNNVVGDYPDNSGRIHTCLYDGKAWTTIDMPGAYHTQAFGISGNNIIGSFVVPPGKFIPFLYNLKEKTGIILNDLPGMPCGIDGNVIVGTVRDVNNKEHGFFGGLKDGPWTSFDVPGAISTVATGISGNNIIGTFVGANNKSKGGFLYAIKEKTCEILNMPEASRTNLFGIDGNVIVGTYIDVRHKHHGFLYDTVKKTWTTLDMPKVTEVAKGN